VTRERFHCRFCGALTFNPRRVCGHHKDLLELDWEGMASEYLAEVDNAAARCDKMTGARG
jgi:hypothetical protein